MFVPSSFNPPLELKTPQFLLRPLTIDDVDIDFEAVKNSLDYRGGEDITVKNLTRKQNLINLGWHQREFQLKKSFAYTVLTPDESKCLGCVYINPPTRGDYDAEIWLWVRKEYFEELDDFLYQEVKKWLSAKWPFRKVAFPGREISWEIWDKLK